MTTHSSNYLTIQEKIEKAQAMFEAWSEELAQEQSIGQLLEKLARNAARSQEAMVRLGVVACCTACEVEEGGSCCGAGIENRYTPTLLLINLLLGQSLPLTRPRENSCHFLSERGCSLMARHVLCINYLCHKIEKKLTMEELMKLQAVTGEEMETGFVLHEKIHQHIQRKRQLVQNERKA